MTATGVYDTAVDRWAGVGPYYAMFPTSFAFDVVREYSKEGNVVLDPFAGRGSSVYAAAAQNRSGIGMEINPVGWLYSNVKVRPAPSFLVTKRLVEIGLAAGTITEREIDALPEFYHVCFSRKIRGFLLSARRELEWLGSRVDATLMAILLIYLHGKKDAALSNQLRQGKSMAPEYAVNWWRKHNHEPPDIDPLPFMAKRIKWRYAKGRPRLRDASVYLGDCMPKLRRITTQHARGKSRQVDLLFTSPPYYKVTNYHYDQWLRLWLLGGPELPAPAEGRWEGRFWSQEAYAELITDAFRACARLMGERSIAYVRTDAREFTRNTTLAALESAFPGRSVTEIPRPFEGGTQTALFGDKDTKPGEVDIIVRPRRRRRSGGRTPPFAAEVGTGALFAQSGCATTQARISC